MTKPGKKNKSKHGRSLAPRIIAALLLVLIVLGALGTALAYGYSALRDIWQEQCRVSDRELDVVITSTGKMVHQDVITMHFGLTNGANLATIPFAELRANLLEKRPNIRDIRIERRLPNRVTVDIFEREPIVRVTTSRTHGVTGFVADAEGVVFEFQRNTSLLPLVRESAVSATPPGKKLAGNAAAALHLVEMASLPELSGLHVLEVDTSHADYLLVTLGNYDRAKIAWDHMLDNSRLSRESLRRQLKHLSDVIATQLTLSSTTMWDATDFGPGGRIYATAPTRGGNQ